MGDPDVDRDEEFQWLFLAEYPAIVRTTYLVLHDHARAEEIAQDAFVQLLRHWDQVRDYESPQGWLRRVAIRLAVREAQRDRNREWLTRRQPHLPVADEHAQDGDPELMAAIRQLSPRQRSIVVLFYFEDQPMDAIAASSAARPRPDGYICTAPASGSAPVVRRGGYPCRLTGGSDARWSPKARASNRTPGLRYQVQRRVSRSRRRNRATTLVAVLASTLLALLVMPRVLDLGRDGPQTASEPPNDIRDNYVVDIGNTAVARAEGMAGRWVVSFEADGVLDIRAPAGFSGSTSGITYRVEGDRLRTDALVEGPGCQATSCTRPGRW